MSVVDVSPVTAEPTHHISLSDGKVTLGFIAVKSDGTPDYGTIRRTPYPRSTLKSSSSDSGLSETRPPYGEFSRTDWSGGFGQENAEDDRTKFLFSRKLWLMAGGKILPAPRLQRSLSVDNPKTDALNGTNFGTVTKLLMVPGTSYAWRIQTDAGGIASVSGITARIHVNVHSNSLFQQSDSISLRFYNSAVGDAHPGTPFSPERIITALLDYSDDEVGFYIPGGVNLAANTYYFLAFSVSGNNKSDAYFLLDSTVPSTAFSVSTDGGVTWTNPAGYLLPLDIGIRVSQYPPTEIPFKYKRNEWSVLNANNGSTKSVRVFRNGDYGVCTASAAWTELDDTSKNWTVDMWKGATVAILTGTKAGKTVKITSNSATALYCSLSDELQPPAGSEYVIYDTDVWYEITGHGLTYPVSSVCVTNEDVIYFAMGSVANIRRTGWYNNAGVWTSRGWADETTKADLLTFCWDQAKKSVIWRALNGSKPLVSRAAVPAWGTAIPWETDISIGNDSPIKAITYYDGKLAIRKSDSIWMIQDGLPDMLSINMSRYSTESGINNMAVFSPYLVFPYNNKVQRLLGQLAENMNLELPVGYRGEPVSFVAIPNGLFVGINAATATAATYSGVYVYHDGAWFTVAHLPSHVKLLAIDYERVEFGYDRLWIFSDSGWYYIRIPRDWDYSRDATADQYQYENYGHLWLGNFVVGNKRLNKYWEDVYIDNASTLYAARVHYNEGTPVPALTSWMVSEDDPTETGTQIVQMKGKALRLMVSYDLLTANATRAFKFTPSELQGMGGLNVKYLARVDDADTWIVPVIIETNGQDLLGTEEDWTAAQKSAQLDAWSRDVTPLIMRSIDQTDDNKRVLIGRNTRQPQNGDTTVMPDSGERNYAFYTSITIYEVI